jgi:hypothetical protein
MTLQDRGSSMVFALLILFAILALGVASLSGAASGLMLSNNYRTGTQAMHAAEAGLVHAIALINAGGGVTSFKNAGFYNTATPPVYGWTTFSGWSTPTLAMASPYANIGYTVIPSSDPDRDPAGANLPMRMLLTAVGQAPGESQRTVQAHLGLTGPLSCGAIDLPNTPISSTFHGSSFLVDGHDYSPMSATPIAGATPTLGISTRNQSDATEIVDGLGHDSPELVQGTPVGTDVPSVGTCSGPSVGRVRDQIVPNILNQPCTTASPSCKVTNPSLNGSDPFGTVAHPQITYYTGDVVVPQHGNMSGAGVLIIDGGLTVNGSIDFTGLIIVRGTTSITETSGHATIYGAIWTTNLNLQVSGNAQVLYSSQALAMANTGIQPGEFLLPQKAIVLGWGG